MSRVRRKSTGGWNAIGERFAYVIEEELGWTLSKAAKELGYANPTTLYAIKHGKALPDPEKLVAAVQKFSGPRGSSINLHWVMTGDGPVFLDTKRGRKAAAASDDIINLIARLSEPQKEALNVLLGKR